MRTAGEIQIEIQQTEAEIASLEKQIAELEAFTDSQEGQLARRQYIDNGDVSGMNTWYNRRDQLARDKREEARMTLDRKKEEARELASKEQAVKNALGSYMDLKKVYDDDRTSTKKAAMNGALRAYETAMQEYINVGGEAGKYPIPQDTDNTPKDDEKDLIDVNGIPGQVALNARVNDIVTRISNLKGMSYDLRGTDANKAKWIKKEELESLKNDVASLLKIKNLNSEAKAYLEDIRDNKLKDLDNWTEQAYIDNGNKWPDWQKPAPKEGSGAGGTPKASKGQIGAAQEAFNKLSAREQAKYKGKSWKDAAGKVWNVDSNGTITGLSGN